jgi:hypothetical protein
MKLIKRTKKPNRLMKKNGGCVILTLILPLQKCGAFKGRQQQKVSVKTRNEEIFNEEIWN